MAIGVLRFVGILNAGVWLGTEVFWICGVQPAVFSSGMAAQLGQGNFPYFSGVISHVLSQNYYRLYIACGIVALIHWCCERIYFGRSTRKHALGLVLALVAAGVVCSHWLEPRQWELHRREHAVNLQPADREAAAHSRRIWQSVSHAVNFVVLVGLVVYVWRVNTPVDTPRFVSSVQLRG